MRAAGRLLTPTSHRGRCIGAKDVGELAGRRAPHLAQEEAAAAVVADRLQRVTNGESDQDDCRPAMDGHQKVEKMRVRADHRGDRDHAEKQGRETRWRGASGQVADDRDLQ